MDLHINACTVCLSRLKRPGNAYRYQYVKLQTALTVKHVDSIFSIGLKYNTFVHLIIIINYKYYSFKFQCLTTYQQQQVTTNV